MIEGRIKNLMIVLAAVGTFMSVFAAVQAAEDTTAVSTDESTETFCEETEETFETIETYETYGSEVTEETSETSFESVISAETYESCETSYSVETDETQETSETSETEETEEAVHDHAYCYINGWYVPSFDYNDNGTVTYYLEDGTPFYSIEMNDLDLPDYAWAYTGLRGYIDYCYGSINGLDESLMESFEEAADSILSGQGA